MTLDEINKLPAGRELDALVAEKVFGWHRRAIFDIGGPTISKQKDGMIWVWVKEDYMGPDEVAEAETAPHAICKAALILAEEGRLPE